MAHCVFDFDRPVLHVPSHSSKAVAETNQWALSRKPWGMWSGPCSLDIATHQAARHWRRQSREQHRICNIWGTINLRLNFSWGWDWKEKKSSFCITHIWKVSPVLCAGLPDTVMASIATGWEQTRVGCSICRRSSVSKSPFPVGVSKLNHCVLQPGVQFDTSIIILIIGLHPRSKVQPFTVSKNRGSIFSLEALWYWVSMPAKDLEVRCGIGRTH